MICRKCKYEFTRDCDTCPRCGHRYGGTTGELSVKFFALLLGLIALGLAVRLWMAMPERGDTSEAPEKRADLPKPLPARRTPQPEIDGLRFR